MLFSHADIHWCKGVRAEHIQSNTMVDLGVNGHQISRSFATLMEMLADRGVETGSIGSKPFANTLSECGAGKSEIFAVDVGMFRIIYNLMPKFKMNDLKKHIEWPHNIIIVSKDKQLLPRSERDIELFELAELQYNLSRHELVPLHEPIRDEATIEQLLADYQLKSRYHLPLILSTDPMARYLALKPGQLVRIVRPSPSAGTYVNYRCCN